MGERDFLTPKDVLSYFQEAFPSADVSEVFGGNFYNEGRDTGWQFLQTSGLRTAPKVLLNGVVLDDSSVSILLSFAFSVNGIPLLPYVVGLSIIIL